MKAVMTSFGWKRKIGSQVSKNISHKFENNAKEHDDALINDEVDWLTLAPKRQCLQLEDAFIKSARLRQEGVTLAESERYWEAIRKWDEALQLTSTDEKLYEMKAQALISLGEVFPAVNMAEKVVALNGKWWIGHQTLGRALLSLGEVKLALKSFCRSFHLNPADEELLQDDLLWALELVNRKNATEQQVTSVVAGTNSQCHIVELDVDGNNSSDLDTVVPFGGPLCQSTVMDSSKEVEAQELQRLPLNYVIMRD